METDAINEDEAIATFNEIAQRWESMRCEFEAVVTGLKSLEAVGISTLNGASVARKRENASNYERTKAACARARVELEAIERLMATLPELALALWNQRFPGATPAQLAAGKVAIARWEAEFADGERFAVSIGRSGAQA